MQFVAVVIPKLGRIFEGYSTGSAFFLYAREVDAVRNPKLCRFYGMLGL
jgi:hypothetical protein